jgi:hypothetical protein
MGDEDTNDTIDTGSQPSEQLVPVNLPPQSSASNTSNQDNQVSVAPDGTEHIKDLGSDDQVINK